MGWLWWWVLGLWDRGDDHFPVDIFDQDLGAGFQIVLDGGSVVLR